MSGRASKMPRCKTPYLPVEPGTKPSKKTIRQLVTSYVRKERAWADWHGNGKSNKEAAMNTAFQYIVDALNRELSELSDEDQWTALTEAARDCVTGKGVWQDRPNCCPECLAVINIKTYAKSPVFTRRCEKCHK